MIIFVGPGVRHLTNIILFSRGRGYLNLSSPDAGPTWARRGEGFDCRLGRKRLRPNICFPTSTLNARDVRSGMKDLEIMEANENYPKVSGFYCINQLNLLRYCGIKVNGSKEKPSRCLQVQLISVWLTFATITV